MKKPKNKKRCRIVLLCAAGLLVAAGIGAALLLMRDPNYYKAVQKEAPARTPAATGSFLQPWYCADWTEKSMPIFSEGMS